MRSAILEISLLLAAFILGWLKTGWSALFYIAMVLIVFYIIIMAIYAFTKGASMSGLDKLLGVIAIAVWLVTAWAMIQEKYYHLWGILP